MGKLIIGTALMVLSFNTFAASVSTTTTIIKMYTYGEDSTYHNDMVIKVATPLAGCESGFWLKSTDSLASKNMSAFLISAFHANSKVYFAAYNNQMWAGSTPAKYCKIHSVGLVK
ncbi:MAG: hypothetical protein HRT35_08740 [Algicola sp.]|nr:hypothetical protein [Algicola sp.]